MSEKRVDLKSNCTGRLSGKRKAAAFLLALVLIATSSGCLPSIPLPQTPQIQATDSTEQPLQPTKVLPTATPTPEPTEMPYPTSTEGFLLDTRGFRLSDRNAITEIGEAQNMRKVEELYGAKIKRNGGITSDFHFRAVFLEAEGKQYWEDVVQDSSYHFLGMKITAGKDAGKVSVGLSKYLADYKAEDDFFDFIAIENPPEYPKADQEIFWDKSGNPIVGIIKTKGYLSAWYNMAKGEQGGWEIVPLPAGETEAQDIWQLSPDGHIYYNEKELYDGMFTINKEHPEWVEQYWEDTIRGLWNLNFVSENKAFINQFPTDDALIDYLKNGGGPVSNLWIPAIYPNAARLFLRAATMMPTSGKINLSKIAIGIYKPTTEEIYKYSPSYATGTKYISYLGAAGEVMIEETDFNGEKILKMTFRRDILLDATRSLCTDKTGSKNKDFTLLALSTEKKDDENLMAAVQLLRSWPTHMQIRDTEYAKAIIKNVQPPAINFNTIAPFYSKYEAITTLESSPITLR
ncbi:MAG: hypothetical protein GX415_00860 [Chloroflexi bacterium]|jgi:hypothetical protein|nr:hypothetical protein [Anaerolineaceae bacterium]NLI43960.1 hypothetical protein [Chloroflexota bacterium]HOE35330.1 hypothetical protein [Anaerolineaceae bacterium]HOT26048.1 hypothetical protein [Anaerolineaceae bacterium]HQH58169.1 hypothetical protein [Anaerolineaceae bacterium]